MNQQSIQKLVDRLQPMAQLLSQASNGDSPFYQFINANPKHADFLMKLTKELRNALNRGFDDNGTYKNLLAEYLDKVEILAQGNKQPLIELFSEDTAALAVEAFQKNLEELETLNKQFVAFSDFVKIKPSSHVNQTKNDVEQLVSDFILVEPENHDAPTEQPLPASRSGYQITGKYGQPLGSNANLSDTIRVMPISDTPVVRKMSSFKIIENYAPTEQPLPASRPGYQITGKYGQPLGNVSLSDTIRVMPISDTAATQEIDSFEMIENDAPTEQPLPASRPGYQITGKYGQPLGSNVSLSDTIREMPDTNQETAQRAFMPGYQMMGKNGQPLTGSDLTQSGLFVPTNGEKQVSNSKDKSNGDSDGYVSWIRKSFFG